MTTRIRTHPKPTCPRCGAQMTLRRPGAVGDWKPFWGCSDFPDCPGKVRIDEDGNPETDDEDAWWEALR